MSGDVFPGPDSEFGARVRARLRDERMIWLTTVGKDGTPQPNPVWFVWQDPAEVLIYSRADAQRLRHIADRSRVAVHFNAGPDGDNVIVLTGSAEVKPETPAPHEHDAYLAKYRSAMTRVSGSPEAFSSDYPVPLVVHVGRARGF